jgi:hypothetical protein
MADTNKEVVQDVRPGTAELHHRKKSLVEVTGDDGQIRTVNLQELSEADAQLAAQFGYKPVFKREFGYLSTFSFAVSISGLFSTIMTTFIYPLEAGGSASAVWCWLISGAGCMCIAVSNPAGTLEPLAWSTIVDGLLTNNMFEVLCRRAGLRLPHVRRIVRFPRLRSSCMFQR